MWDGPECGSSPRGPAKEKKRDKNKNGFGLSPRPRTEQGKFVKEVDDEINRKAIIFASHTVGIERAREFFAELIASGLGLPCPYCGNTLTIDNVSDDHKDPMLRGTDKTDEERRYLDRKENHQIICRQCNARKSNFSHSEYQALLDFLRGFDDGGAIFNKVMSRLSFANTVWSKKGKR